MVTKFTREIGDWQRNQKDVDGKRGVGIVLEGAYGPVFFDYGDLCVRYNKLEEAEKLYLRAVSTPHSQTCDKAGAHRRLSRLYLSKNRLKEAETILQQGLEAVAGGKTLAQIMIDSAFLSL